MSTADQLRELLNDLYAAFSTGDARPWTEHAAEDVLGIGSDEDEWWQGRSVFTQVVAAQMQEISSSGGRLTAGDPQVFAQGDVAWVVDRPFLHLGDGTDLPMRATLIADTAAGTLRIRHSHFSVGVNNEQVFGQELTTG
jgi:ketosteroid isomerase-like protein